MDALDGITVLDFTSHLAGPYCTKLLADMGARVIKVERPGGDPTRALSPFLADEPGEDRGATWHYLNTNKESIVIDLANPAARDVVRRLMAGAQLAVTSFAPASEERLGIDCDTLRQYADIPVVSITNFGHAGPYRDYRLSDTVLYAMGAEMYSHGLAHREPLKLGGTAATLQGGANGEGDLARGPQARSHPAGHLGGTRQGVGQCPLHQFGIRGLRLGCPVIRDGR